MSYLSESKERILKKDKEKISRLSYQLEKDASNGLRTILMRGYSIKLAKPFYGGFYTTYTFHLINGQKISFRDYLKNVDAIKFIAFQVIYALDRLVPFTRRTIKHLSTAPEIDFEKNETPGNAILRDQDKYVQSSGNLVYERDGKLIAHHFFSMTSEMERALERAWDHHYLSYYNIMATGYDRGFFGFSESCIEIELNPNGSEEYYENVADALYKFSKIDDAISHYYPGNCEHPQYWFKIGAREKTESSIYVPVEEYFFKFKTGDEVIHPQFGECLVCSSKREGNLTLTVRDTGETIEVSTADEPVKLKKKSYLN